MYPLSYPKNTTSTKQGNFSSLNLFSRQLWLHMYYLLKFGKARKTKSQGWIFFWKNFSLTSHKYQGMYVCMLVEIIHSFQDFLCLWHDMMHICHVWVWQCIFFHLPLVDQILLPSKQDFWIVSVKSHPQ